jgi:hypothetical protein
MVLTVTLPVRTISVRLIRKKEERLTNLHWNATLRQLDLPWCEKCGTLARPLFLCETMYCLCKACFGACPKMRAVVLPRLPGAMQVRWLRAVGAMPVCRRFNIRFDNLNN